MSISKIILKSVEPWKNVLKKIVPISLLRKIKSIIVKNNIKKFNTTPKLLFDKDKYEKGINLIGNIKIEIGLGQSCRLVANELKNSDIEFMIYNFVLGGNVRNEDRSFDYKIQDELKYGINLVHINPYEMGLAYIEFGKKAFDYRYNIAFWLWELEEFPDEWVENIALFDEIWTPSEFASNSIRKKTSVPVYTIPYCVTVPVKSEYNREYFGLPEDIFLYLIMYDSNSTSSRKNPQSAIEAYKKICKENKDVGLVIKVNNAVEEELEQLKNELKEYQNIYFIVDTLEKVQVNSLIQCVDVFVSLHRAEGFGLVMAEAMLLGMPVVATNWSSNTEFMNSDVACMVGYDLVEIKDTEGHYKKGQRWAEPDIGQAVFYMQKLYNDKEFYMNISTLAKKYIEDKLSMENAVKLINERVEIIYKE